MSKNTERIVILIMYAAVMSFGWTIGITIAEIARRFL